MNIHSATRALFGAALLLASSFTIASAAGHTITGRIVADNEVRIYTAVSEVPAMTVTYQGVSACWSTSVPVNINTTNRYLYLTCWSDLSVAQGLLHDLTVDGTPVYSGHSLWRVLPNDSVMAACTVPGAGVVEAAMASRIPTGTFVVPTVGCQNNATCYGVWGQSTLISSAAKWSWFNSGNQVSGNAPFQPGFNHREFLIFRLDMQQVATPTRLGSWGQIKTMYR